MIIDEVEDVNSIMNQLNLTDILKTLHRATAANTFFSSTQGTFSKIDHMSAYKTNLNKLKSWKGCFQHPGIFTERSLHLEPSLEAFLSCHRRACLTWERIGDSWWQFPSLLVLPVSCLSPWCSLGSWVHEPSGTFSVQGSLYREMTPTHMLINLVIDQCHFMRKMEQRRISILSGLHRLSKEINLTVILAFYLNWLLQHLAA